MCDRATIEATALGALMARMRALFVIIMAAVFLLAAGALSAEVTCEELRLKPLRCVGGTVIDEAGEVVSRADVTILKDGKDIATVETGVDGKFEFEDLKAAGYDLRVRAVGFRLFQVPIVAQSHAKKCKRALEIVLVRGVGEKCMGVRLVKR